MPSAFCPILNNAVQSSEEGDGACSCYIALKNIEMYSIIALNCTLGGIFDGILQNGQDYCYFRENVVSQQGSEL